MRQKAYNRLITPDGTAHGPVIVRFTDDGQFLDFRPLIAEEPFVEWEGGTLDLRSARP